MVRVSSAKSSRNQKFQVLAKFDALDHSALTQRFDVLINAHNLKKKVKLARLLKCVILFPVPNSQS